MEGIAGDLFFQMVIQGKRRGCLDGQELAMAGIMGALSGGLAAPAAEGLPQLGGAYSKVCAAASEARLGGQVHHMPSWSATRGAGIAGILIQSGRYLDALKMDVDAIRAVHGARYEAAIQQMGEYVWRMGQ